MNRDEIRTLFRYNDWANDIILAQAAKLTSERLRAANDFGWGSLHGALVHLMDAEIAWRQLLEKGADMPLLEPDDFPDLASVRARWDDERQETWRWLNGLGDADLRGEISYPTEYGERKRVLWHCLAHVVNHGTQHRSECAALLTGYGHSPGSLDFITFLSKA